MPKPESAFFKANPFSGPEIKENPFRKWSRLDFCLYLEEEDDEVQKAMTRSLNKARKIHQDIDVQDQPNPPITLEEIIDDTTQESLVEIESWPPNKFGRGQVASSFQRSQVSTGWKPKPFIQWKLLGGAGGRLRKKTGPKAKESGIGKLNHYINHKKSNLNRIFLRKIIFFCEVALLFF